MKQSILITNIKQIVGITYPQIAQNPVLRPLRGKALAHLESINDAFLLIEDGQIKDFGKMSALPNLHVEERIDANGGFMLPAFCDSHTHLVFAATREQEFEMRIKGATYEQIAASGGGILNSARKLQAMSEDELFELAHLRLAEAQKYGTAAIEIKSGYGLTTEAELKMLRVIRRLKETSNMTIKSTFLGAHAVPTAFKNNRAGYVRLVTHEMLPRIAQEGLADFIDVFCEKLAFSADETNTILDAGAKWGLRPKIHTNQFNSIGGIETALQYEALSVDHLEVLNDDEIELLSEMETIATLLPTAPFFLNDPHTPPARKLIDSGCAVALATDFNPGTTPSVKMPFVISLACIRLRMLPEEALNAATLNGAFAMTAEQQTGSIELGKRADLILTKPVPSLAYLPYAFGSDWIERVWVKGTGV